MYCKFFLVFLLHFVSVRGKINALGDKCITRDNRYGVCQYVGKCTGGGTTRQGSEGPKICGFEGFEVVVCCPNNYAEPGLLNPQESPLCPKLPHIRTPATLLQHPAHVVAFEKCIANERFLHVCQEEDGQYRRVNSCAISNSSARISVGTPVALKELPHLAALQCDNEWQGGVRWMGFGSLLSEKYILTSAAVLQKIYCVVRYALLGATYNTVDNGGELFSVIRRIPHVGYSSSNGNHNIALLELDRPVQFSEYIRPICLPVPAIAPANDIRRVAGLEINDDIFSTTRIFQVDISEVNGNECASKLPSSGRFSWNNETMICAQGRSDRYERISCRGDGGLPLMYKVTNEEFSCNYVVAGVTSHGVCDAKYPTAYTKVAAHLDWIVETVWPDELRIAMLR